MSSKTIYEILNVQKEDIPFSESAHYCTQTYVHYYRVRNAYYCYVNKIPYHNYDYKLFPDNYLRYAENRVHQIEYTIYSLREQKNQVLNPHIENYRFFYYDRNRPMYYVTKHLIRKLYEYYLFMINPSGLSSPEKENDYVQEILDAYTLLYYMVDREVSLSNEEVDRLLESM